MFMLSHLGAELMQVVRSCPLASVGVSGDRYSFGYSPLPCPKLRVDRDLALAVRLARLAESDPRAKLDIISK